MPTNPYGRVAALGEANRRGRFRRVRNPEPDLGTLAHVLTMRGCGPERIQFGLDFLPVYVNTRTERGAQWWVDDDYVVQVANAHAEGKAHPGFPAVLWLRVYRRDGERIPNHWPELQGIKNEIVGPEHFGFEIYPSESKLQDGENSYHLWVFAEPSVTIGCGLLEDRQLPHGIAPSSSAAIPTRFIREKVAAE